MTEWLWLAVFVAGVVGFMAGMLWHFKSEQDEFERKLEPWRFKGD